MRFKIQSFLNYAQILNNQIKYRNFCDMRIKVNDGISVIKMKRAVRLSGLFELEDKGCFFRTQCPVCPVDDSAAIKSVDLKKHNKRIDIYVNKTTGMSSCLFSINCNNLCYIMN